MSVLPNEVAAELKTLRAVKALCVELCGLLEAVAYADPSEESDEYDDAMTAFWNREEDICRRVMTLLPEEFPSGHVRVKA